MKILLIMAAFTFLFSGEKQTKETVKDMPLKHLQLALDSTNQKLDTLLILIQ